MKNKLLISFIALFIFSLALNISSQSLRFVNFQGAGWVTAVKYTSTPNKLYARTDVGGVFRSDNNGQNWNFISGYAVTSAALNIQGIAVHPTNSDIVYACVGVSYQDTDPERGIWKTINGGSTWTHVQSTISFSGNDDIRWGGECIALDPANPEIIYAGGRGSGVYKSTNGGTSWTQIAASNVITGNISSITIRPGTSGNTAEIWVGSEGTAGVWRSQNGGSSWTQMRTSGQVEGIVFRITVKTNGNAFVAYNESMTSYTSGSGTWANITGFTSGQGSFAAVHFMGNENTVIASRMDYTRLSNDGGATFPTLLPMTMTGTLPKHSFDWTVVNWARNHFQQNPANTSEWYMSGGFGCLQSTDAGQHWRYRTDGINIPVMYRTHFHLTNPNFVFLPMGDLTCGRLTDGGTSGEVTDYAFYSFNVLQDFSNATVVMTTAANTGKIYIAGGNLYAGETPGVFITTNNGANYTRLAGTGLPNVTGRPVINGVASDANQDHLIVQIGGDYSNIGTVGGIYWSENGGANFTRSGGLAQNILGPNTYYYGYGLVKDPLNTSKRYCYFEGDGGGFYESNDEGKNWTLKNQVISGYKPTGTLVIHPATSNLLYLAVTGYGLYKSIDAGTTWANMNGWLDAQQVDTRGNTIVAFGMRTGDTYNKIYKSTNSGSAWDPIVTGNFKLPNTTSLIINPFNNDQLWVGTTGNGTFIYTGLTIGIQPISSEIPSSFNLSQNYPNPFNPVTNIEFNIPNEGTTSRINLTVFDVLGKQVQTLVNENLKPGKYKVDWNASDFPSGIYFYRLSSGENVVDTKKMILVK